MRNSCIGNYYESKHNKPKFYSIWCEDVPTPDGQYPKQLLEGERGAHPSNKTLIQVPNTLLGIFSFLYCTFGSFSCTSTLKMPCVEHFHGS